MNKTLAVFLVAAAMLSIAATNLYIPGSSVTFGTPEATATPTNAVKVLPHTDTVQAPPTNWSLLIAVAVPAIISGLKSWVPKMPTWLLPIMAPLLGALLDLVMQLSGTPTSGVVNSALLGSAGVGLRELQDQVKQRMVKPRAPAEPPPANPPVDVPPKPA